MAAGPSASLRGPQDSLRYPRDSLRLCYVNAGGVDDDVPRYPQFSKSFYFAEDGDVILTRRLLEVNGTVCGSLPAPAIRIAGAGDGGWIPPHRNAHTPDYTEQMF